MVSKNDITGDSIQTRVASKLYENNFDSIFPEKYGIVKLSSGEEMSKCSKRCWLEERDNKFSCSKPNCSNSSIQDF